MNVLKSSGKQERFNQRKLVRSLLASGLSPSQAQRVARDVAQKQPKATTTDKIFSTTRRHLTKTEPALAYRYNLKRALMELGPSGFPFEKLVGRILEAHGYKTSVGNLVYGYCVRHEVDVIAKKGNREIFIEAKFHNRPGRKTDVGVLMYSHARFIDVAKAHKKRGSGSTHEGWVVTNTQCSSEAIKYSRCTGIKILSWAYPRGSALKELIEKKRVYPITVMPNLTRQAKQKLFEAGVVVLSDFLKQPAHKLARLTRQPVAKLTKLQETARQLLA